GRIAIRLAREDGNAVLSIRDDGVGIPRENLDLIFDLYAQVDRPRLVSGGGLGIGLTLVRKLVEMHGGTVRAESEGLGRGSLFSISPRLADAMPLPAPPREPRLAPPSPRRVLVVEDQADVRQGLAELLRIFGHEVAAASDGPSALEASRALRPDLVLLDI